MKIRVVTLKSPWEILADAGAFSHGERFRETKPTPPTSKRGPKTDRAGMRGAK